MRDFEITVDIDAPPERVWNVMIDVERWHEWTRSISSIHKLQTSPLDVGGRARVVQPKLRPAIWTVTQLVQGRNFTWQTRSPGVRVSGCHSVEPRNDGSRVTLSVRFDGVLGGLIGTILKKLNEEYLQLESRGLKQRAESEVAVH
jgi:uncharacterized protein YndB with AHSA1/START domain